MVLGPKATAVGIGLLLVGLGVAAVADRQARVELDHLQGSTEVLQARVDELGEAHRKQSLELAGLRQRIALLETATPEAQFGPLRLDNGPDRRMQLPPDFLSITPQELFRQVRIVPNFTGGEMNGFKLFAIRRSSFLREVGFENNDVVLSVNGAELTSAERATEIYEEQKDRTSFDVLIRRGTSEFTLHVEVPDPPASPAD